jgi:DNA-binding protein YbaB
MIMSRRELVSLDVLGSDEELRAAAAREQRSPGGAEAEGRDPSRAVTIRVDGRGRVADVLISNWWRDDLTPSGLQEAVLSAYRDGLAQATAQLAPQPAEEATPTGGPAEPDDHEGDDHGWFLGIRRRLDRTEEALAQSGERLAQAQGPARVISGPAGLVRLVLTGGIVSEVQIDARAALEESPNRLAADALAAFQTID